MIYELPVSVGERTEKVFLQDDFVSAGNNSSTTAHRHFHCEVHIVCNGDVRFYIGKEVYDLTVGDVIAIPANCYHWRTVLTDDANIFALTADYDLKKTHISQIDKNLLKSFADAMENTDFLGTVNKLSAYIALFWCCIFENDLPGVVPTEDYSFLINNFFEIHFAEDVTLEDLATSINLSPKQTTRLVIKYTGNNFRNELGKRRVLAAKELLESTNLGKEEVAEMVGYASYSSLWKAIKTFGFDV